MGGEKSRRCRLLLGFYTPNAGYTGPQKQTAPYDDWRLCLPVSIADEDGVIPRTPKVFMENDPNWFSADQLSTSLRTLINGTD